MAIKIEAEKIIRECGFLKSYIERLTPGNVSHQKTKMMTCVKDIEKNIKEAEETITSNK